MIVCFAPVGRRTLGTTPSRPARRRTVFAIVIVDFYSPSFAESARQAVVDDIGEYSLAFIFVVSAPRVAFFRAFVSVYLRARGVDYINA
jgi:hypothetical protein